MKKLSRISNYVIKLVLGPNPDKTNRLDKTRPIINNAKFIYNSWETIMRSQEGREVGSPCKEEEIDPGGIFSQTKRPKISKLLTAWEDCANKQGEEGDYKGKGIYSKA